MKGVELYILYLHVNAMKNISVLRRQAKIDFFFHNHNEQCLYFTCDILEIYANIQYEHRIEN